MTHPMTQTAAQPAMLQAEKLSFTYPGAASLFQNLSFLVQPGQRLALEGASGAGKSTLCKLLAGYLQAQSGSVMLGGQQPQKISGKAYPIQLIWQHPEQAFDPRTRLRVSLLEGGTINPQLCETFGIKRQWMSRYPHELSGGELQRFSIVRALTAKPDILICDEISTMLDAITQADIWANLLREQQQQGFGMIFVSHSQALTKHLATAKLTLA